MVNLGNFCDEGALLRSGDTILSPPRLNAEYQKEKDIHDTQMICKYNTKSRNNHPELSMIKESLLTNKTHVCASQRAFFSFVAILWVFRPFLVFIGSKEYPKGFHEVQRVAIFTPQLFLHASYFDLIFFMQFWPDFLRTEGIKIDAVYNLAMYDTYPAIAKNVVLLVARILPDLETSLLVSALFSF